MGAEIRTDDARLRPMSLEAWAGLPEDEPGEWIDGWLVEEEVGSYLHDLIVGWFIATLRAWIVPLGGSVIASELKFALPAGRGRKPDVSVFRPGNRPPITSQIVDRPPDIAVEVVSSTPRDQRRDRLEKFVEYAAFGVPSYWIVDPQARTFEVFELGSDGRYIRAAGASIGKVSVPGCDGLRVDLDALWTEADAHESR